MVLPPPQIAYHLGSNKMHIYFGLNSQLGSESCVLLQLAPKRLKLYCLISTIGSAEFCVTLLELSSRGSFSRVMCSLVQFSELEGHIVH